MKTPPFLLLAVLAFWGWQSDFLYMGLVLGIILESARSEYIKYRWELSPIDFRRIWQFCTLLVLAVVVYAFAANDDDGGLSAMAHSRFTAARHLGVSATSFLRWLPMTLFLLIVAQIFSERGAVPLSAISLFLNRRRQGLPERDVDISYPYFVICLFSAGIHVNRGGLTYFYGQAALLIWALWPFRSRRYGQVAWAGTLILVLGLGFGAQRGLGELQRLLTVYNARWMSAFWTGSTDPSKSITALGRLGRLKLSPQIIVRLETENGAKPPEYLREATYRRYGKEVWSAGAGRNDFDTVPNDSTNNQYSWTLVRNKTNGPVIHIACYLEGHSQESEGPEGLLPLPIDTARLDNLHAYLLRTNRIGSVLATGPGLLIFEAQYGAGGNPDSSPDTGTNKFDLFIPTNEIPMLVKTVAELQIRGTNLSDKLSAVESFFANNFKYSTWGGSDKLPKTTNETPLGHFLTDSRTGHCEYFASATVLLLREMGIPARYAVGYYIHEHTGNKYVARGRDAHAWCLVWDDAAKIWRNFDTTPGSWIAVEENRAPMTQWLTDLFSAIHFQIAKLRWGQENLRQYIFWALIPVMALLLYQVIFRRGRRKRSPSGGNAIDTAWPGLDSEFYELEKKLAARGLPRDPGEPLGDWLNRALQDPALANLETPLRQLLRLHYAYRFDPRGLTPEKRVALSRDARVSLSALEQVRS